MNYGNLKPTYCITATNGKAVNYYYFDNKEQADSAETKLKKEGYATSC